MSRWYSGDKPCLGCGRSGKEESRPGVNVLCNQCKSDLSLARKVREKEELVAQHVRVSYRSIYEQLKAPRSFTDEGLKGVDNGIMDFLRTIQVHNPDVHYEDYIPIGSSATSCAWLDVVVPKKQWEAILEVLLGLDRMYSEWLDSNIGDINEKLTKAYRSGKADGEKFVIGLAENKVSSEDLNKPHIKKTS